MSTLGPIVYAFELRRRLHGVLGVQSRRQHSRGLLAIVARHRHFTPTRARGPISWVLVRHTQRAEGLRSSPTGASPPRRTLVPVIVAAAISYDRRRAD